MQALNLGCGGRFHPDWTNLDLVAFSRGVQGYDLASGIPFPDETFEVVYHSHLLEHFPKQTAAHFLRECCRVLKHCGVIRVVVPDLEQIARAYLEALEKAARGEPEWQCNYEWMTLELYDQAVREHSGGGMLDYITKDCLPNEQFVIERIGTEARQTRQAIHEGYTHKAGGEATLRSLSLRFRYLLLLARVAFLKMVLGNKDYQSLKVGRFRRSGEVHHWMYDRYSLGRLLRQSGFENPKRQSAAESQIPGWPNYHLDVETDGSVYKPDSLYMEATKP